MIVTCMTVSTVDPVFFRRRRQNELFQSTSLKVSNLPTVKDAVWTLPKRLRPSLALKNTDRSTIMCREKLHLTADGQRRRRKKFLSPELHRPFLGSDTQLGFIVEHKQSGDERGAGIFLPLHGLSPLSVCLTGCGMNHFPQCSW